jgi:L-histidine Nalpha-methyltransferase
MSVTTPAGIRIEVHLGPEEWAAALRHDAAAGLVRPQKELPPTWFYDQRGCELFEEITRLEEYYPTRTERAILEERADEVAAISGADTLVELGAGTSEKSRILLDALERARQLSRFVPFDVAEPTLRATSEAVAEEYSGLEVVGIVGDFRHHLGTIPADGRRLVAFLGGTIGNLLPPERHRLLTQLHDVLRPGDSLLLGTDLVKDPELLVAAYDDAAGVTAEFNRNVLTVLNRELGADFDIDRFDHVARFDETDEWIEMRLRSRGDQVVHIPKLELTIEFADGEDLRTEISAKFRRAGVCAELAAAGFDLAAWWTDAAGHYALSLAHRRSR